MKRFLTLLLLLVPFFVSAQEHIKIKGVPIDGDVNTFVNKLKATGLTWYSGSGNDTILKGSFAGMSDCSFIFGASQKTKTIFRVAVITEEEISWRSLKRKYENLKDNYAAKYSDGRSYEWFDSPYYEGDGYEIQALRLEKCSYATFYSTPEGTISIEIKPWTTSSGVVIITYEDSANFEIAHSESSSVIDADI